MLERAISLAIGYLFGCILTAELVSRRYTGKSVFEIGSKNPGMANVMSNIGKEQGTMVLLGDIVKTILSMGICWLLFRNSEAGIICIQYAGLGTVLGHNFPFWHRFRGGKGVTVTCSWMILGFGFWGMLADIAGAVVVLFTGWLPLGAVVIGIASIPVAFLISGTEAGVLVCISCALMFSRHWHGLRRIVHGEEPAHMKLRKKEG